MTLITTTIALLHLALGATAAPATSVLQVEEPAPRVQRLSGQEATVEAETVVLPPGRFRLAPGSPLSADPRLYRRDI